MTVQRGVERHNADDIRTELSMHIGSLERYRHWTRRFIYTPGVQALAERAGAFWLIDLIASHFRKPKVTGSEFQVWKLTVHTDRSATLAVDDGSDRQLFKCGIHRMDFPLAEITVYLTEGALLLPSEY